MVFLKIKLFKIRFFYSNFKSGFITYIFTKKLDVFPIISSFNKINLKAFRNV